MDARYFTSKGISLGTVKASSLRTFKDLVDRLLNVAIALNVTRQSYQAMTREEKDNAKKVPYLTPAIFRTNPARRVYENALHCNLIFLDIDEGKDPTTKKPNGTFPAAPYLNNPDMLAAHLEPFSWAAYTTASSTPEGPRMRIVVDAHEIPVSDYAAAVKTIGKRIGLAVVTSESKVAVQAMYLPTLFADQTEDEHPLIDYQLDGRPFTTSDIDADTGVVVNKWEAKAAVKAVEGTALEFLRAPVDEITIDVAREALEALDPDLNYHDWLEVAAALKHQFHHSFPDEAFMLFDSWSSKGTKYASVEETRAKWDSFLHTPVGRVPVTIRSLLKRAVEGGWSAVEVKDECFHKTITWIQKGAKSSSQLLVEGLKRIATTPLISRSEEDALVHQIIKEAKTRFGLTVSLTSLRKELKGVKEDLQSKEPAPKQQVPPWAKGLVFVANGNYFLRQRTHEAYTCEELDNLYGKRLLPTEEMLKAAGLAVTPATLSKPLVMPHHFLLNHIKCPTAYDTTYDPSSPDDLFPVDDGKVFVNTYRRTHPDPSEENAMLVGNAFRAHLEKLILEKEYVRTVLDYFAFLVQHPGRKIRWAILIQGAEGCGKTFLAEVMRLVLGKEHVMAIDVESIKRGWSEWSTGRQLIVIEEIRVVGQNRHEIMNVLKPLITNPRITINQRNTDTREVDNRTNYMAFTNHNDALPVTSESRRWFVIKSRMQTKEHVLQLGKNYFKELFAMIEDNAAGLRWFFENWSISDEFPADGHAPETPYLRQLVQDTANELTATVRRVIKEADHPLVQLDLISSKVLLDLLHTQESLNRVSSNQLAAVLREEHYNQHGRHMVDNERHYLWTRTGLIGPHEDPVAIANERMKKGIRLVDADVLL